MIAAEGIDGDATAEELARLETGGLGAQRAAWGPSGAKVVASARWEQGLRPACPRA